MSVIAIYSVKGGVGKTTLSANLAWCSAQISCRRTLLWDLDAAGGSSFLLGAKPWKKKRANTVFERASRPTKMIRKTGFKRLHLLPADESIRAIENRLTQLGKRKRLAKLTGLLSEGYDRIILDCPPVLNELSAQVLRAADLVIVPMPPSPLSWRAFELVAPEIQAKATKGPAILPVLSMVDMRRSLHRAAVETNHKWPVIPFASVVERGAVRQQPVGAFAPSSPAARRFAKLWAAIEHKLAARGN